jgi:hypothetical protein
MADSAAFSMETTGHHDRFATQNGLTPQTSHPFSWSPSYCFSCHTHKFFRSKGCAAFASLRTFIRHTSCFLRLFSSPVDNVYRWCNTNVKLSTILSLHSSSRTARRAKRFYDKHFLIRRRRRILLLSSGLPMVKNKFSKCVEQSVTNQLQGAEFFLRSRQLRSYSRIFLPFIEPEGS